MATTKKGKIDGKKSLPFTKSEQEVMQQVIKSVRQEAETLFAADPKASRYIKTLKRLELKVS